MANSRSDLSTQLRQARAIALIRLALEHLLGLTAALALLVPITVVLVRWTGRGDLGQSVLVLGCALAISAAAVHLVWCTTRQLRSLSAVARTIVAHSQARDEANERAWTLTDAHALLSAWELGEHGAAAQHSPELTRAYIDQVAADPRRPALSDAFPRLRWRRRLALASAGLLALTTEVILAPPLREGVTWLLEGIDRRPPPQARQLWHTLELALEFPNHTARPPRVVSNPNGALKVPAGTRVSLRFSTDEPARDLRLAVQGQDLDAPKATHYQTLELLSAQRNQAEVWTASFLVRGAGSWNLVLEDGDRDVLSPIFPLEIENDLAPEVELVPLPARDKVTRTTDRVMVKFRAKDDFGLRQLNLVVRLPNGTEHRLPAGVAKSRAVEMSYEWSLSEFPLDERAELEYWIEARDNDPGLGMIALLDGPGKVGTSAHQRLPVDDAELTHGQNLRSLQALRSLAVDVLASRLAGPAFKVGPVKTPEQARARLAALRAVIALHEKLLSSLAQAIEVFASDSLAGPRATKTLSEIHRRLLELFRSDAATMATIPIGREERRDGARLPVLQAAKKLGAHNIKQVAQLEDEIIRLDDLVDGQYLAQIEALIARVTAGQTRLVELLAQLKAGDESVRPAIAQVQQRLNLDMRKLNEARRALSKELGQEYLNQDAFRVLEARMRHLELEKRLREGDVDGALKDAQDALEQMRKVQDDVQDRMSQGDEDTPLSPEERQRAELLRELTRLLEDQKNAHEQSSTLHGLWEPLAAQTPVAEKDRSTSKAGELQKRLAELNDATLGREARTSLDDAKDALSRLESVANEPAQAPTPAAAPAQAPAPEPQANALQRFREALAVAESLRNVQQGTDIKDKQRHTIDQALQEALKLAQDLEAKLPDPRSKLDTPSQVQLRDVTTRQGALGDRSQAIGKEPYAEVFPPRGRAALERAEQAMRDSRQELSEGSLEMAKARQKNAIANVEEAIASLRDTPPPPPPTQPPPSDASTQAEQDRSLRQRIMDVMRDGKSGEKGADVERYYEEILR